MYTYIMCIGVYIYMHRVYKYTHIYIYIYIHTLFSLYLYTHVKPVGTCQSLPTLPSIVTDPLPLVFQVGCRRAFGNLQFGTRNLRRAIPTVEARKLEDDRPMIPKQHVWE